MTPDGNSGYASGGDEPGRAPPSPWIAPPRGAAEIRTDSFARFDLSESLRRSQSSVQSSWALSLVIACLAIGLLGAAVRYEQVRIQNERQRSSSLATAASIAAGNSEDLGELMADSRTRLVRLSGEAGITNASLAWNPARPVGALFCDKLPVVAGGAPYEIWGIGNGGATIHLGDIQPASGVSVYPFPLPTGLGEISRVEITAGPRGAQGVAALRGSVGAVTN